MVENTELGRTGTLFLFILQRASEHQQSWLTLFKVSAVRTQEKDEPSLDKRTLDTENAPVNTDCHLPPTPPAPAGGLQKQPGRHDDGATESQREQATQTRGGGSSGQHCRPRPLPRVLTVGAKRWRMMSYPESLLGAPLQNEGDVSALGWPTPATQGTGAPSPTLTTCPKGQRPFPRLTVYCGASVFLAYGDTYPGK